MGFLGTRANRLATLPFTIGSTWTESDTKVDYISSQGYGNCNVSGTSVTLIGPTIGSSYWYPSLAGQIINISGTDYTIASASASNIILTASAGSLTNAVWTITNAYWFYAGKIETISLASLLARTMSPTDDQYSAFIYDYCHTITYNGVSGAWSFVDSGSNYQVLGATGAPKGGIWVPSNGGATTYLDIISGVPTAVSVTVPNNPGYYFRR